MRSRDMQKKNSPIINAQTPHSRPSKFLTHRPPRQSLALSETARCCSRARALSPPATAPTRYSHGCHAGGISARLPGAVA